LKENLIDCLSYENDLFKKMIVNLILNGKISIKEVSKELRIKHMSFYASALRINRNSCNLSIKILKLILSDIECVETQSHKDKILLIFSAGLQYLEINHSGDKQIENFRETIPKEILRN